ncbi:LptM family lipoprotein [Clostridium sardiniense]|uniref:LptM family lipoprotein n=1 Tax=Clostridium sardiniense TaxID=29369 RepID=UPI003D353B10
MTKKIIGLVITTTLLFSLAGCGSNEKQKTADESTKKAEVNIDNQEQFKDLKGDWIRDFTHDEFVDKSNSLMTSIEDKTKEFGLDYKKEDKVEQIDGVTANVKSIYLDNKDPEANKLESMQFQSQLLGDAQDSGRLQLKLSLKFDGEGAIKDDKFNLGDTSIAQYAAIMTGAQDRNYDDINKQIMDIIKSDKKEGIIKDNINGLAEEFAVSKDYIVYTLSTKVYKFTQNTDDGIK